MDHFTGVISLWKLSGACAVLAVTTVRPKSLIGSGAGSGAGTSVVFNSPACREILILQMCADIVTTMVIPDRLRFRFEGKNGIVRQWLHSSINDKKQFVNKK